MVSIEQLSVEFGVKPLFTDVNFVINRHDRIALVGKNGAGKSTMLKIIAGLQSPSRGRVSKPKELTIGYLPQVMILSDTMTVRQETEKAFASTIALEQRLAEMNSILQSRTDYESQSYADLIEAMTELNEQLTVIQSQNRDAEIERTLIGLGFERTDFDRPTCEFSGGWRMRIELAKILLQRPNLLLLDEPTNHLDIESIQWLEKFLAQSGSSVVLVSHDRAFLDNVTNRTIEITCGTIHDYNVNYSKYVVLHQERIEQQRRAYLNQQKELQETRDFIERFRYQATKAIQVQSRIKWLEKQVPIEIDEVDNSRLNLKFLLPHVRVITPSSARMCAKPTTMSSSTTSISPSAVVKRWRSWAATAKANPHLSSASWVKYHLMGTSRSAMASRSATMRRIRPNSSTTTLPFSTPSTVWQLATYAQRFVTFWAHSSLVVKPSTNPCEYYPEVNAAV